MIDIHSTTTQGQDFAIIKSDYKKLNNLLKAINYKEVVVMPRGVIDGTVINFCPGATIEFNKAKYKKSVKKPIVKKKKVYEDNLKKDAYDILREHGVDLNKKIERNEEPKKVVRKRKGNGRLYIESEVQNRLEKINKLKNEGYPLRIICKMI